MNRLANAVPPCRQRGVSLLEMIAYLGVAATVIIGAIALLSNAFGSARTNRAQQELAAISTGVRRLFMGQAGAFGTGNLNAQLAAAKVFPSTLAVAGDVVTNAWNGNVVVTGNNTVFTISYDNLPQEVCVELLSTSNQFLNVAANGGAPLSPPVTLAQATAQCTQPLTNSVVWTDR
jgi:hypothetical protein